MKYRIIPIVGDSGGIHPSGTLTITSNDVTVDVTQYKYVDVNIPFTIPEVSRISIADITYNSAVYTCTIEDGNKPITDSYLEWWPEDDPTDNHTIQFDAVVGVNSISMTDLPSSTRIAVKPHVTNIIGEYNSATSYFQTEDAPVTIDYFYVENAYNGQNTVNIRLTWYGDYPNLRTTDLAYSKNANEWTSIDVSKPSGSTAKTISVVLNEGERVYVRSSTGLSVYNSSSSHSNVSFHGTNAINVGGNIATLIDYTAPDSVTTVRNGEFYELFHTTTQHPASVVDISNLSLGNITTLEDYAMHGLLYGQSMLTSALDLTGITSTQSNSITRLYYNCSLIDEAWTPNVTRSAAGSSWLYGTASSGVVHIPSGLCVGTSSGCIRENSTNGIPSNWTYDTY